MFRQSNDRGKLSRRKQLIDNKLSSGIVVGVKWKLRLEAFPNCLFLVDQIAVLCTTRGLTLSLLQNYQLVLVSNTLGVVHPRSALPCPSLVSYVCIPVELINGAICQAETNMGVGEKKKGGGG